MMILTNKKILATIQIKHLIIAQTITIKQFKENYLKIINKTAMSAGLIPVILPA